MAPTPATNACLFTLLKLMIVLEQKKHYLIPLQKKDYEEIAQQIYGTSRKISFLQKSIFSDNENSRYTYQLKTLNELTKFLEGSYGFKGFNEFSKNWATDPTVIKYYKNLKNKKGDFNKREKEEILNWAEEECRKLMRNPDNTISTDYSSFTKLITPESISMNADKFYDGSAIQLEELKANFDVPRNLYYSENGIESKVNSIIKGLSPYVQFILIKGVGGSGKSTLCQRIGFDLSLKGKNVFVLNKDWLEDKQESSIQSQIKQLVRQNKEAVFILDNFLDCVLNNQVNFVVLVESLKSYKTLFILTEQMDRWNKIVPKMRKLIDDEEIFHQYHLNQLNDMECTDLAIKMNEFEENGKLSIRHRVLSIEERIQLCKENSQRHLVVAMLQIRYKKKFKEIITDEFEKIPSEEAKNAYLNICFWNELKFNLQESILLRILNLSSILSFNEIRDFTEGLIVYNKSGLSARHPIIAREIYKCFIISSEQILHILVKTFSSLGSDKNEIGMFLNGFFLKGNIHKKLTTILNKQTNYIEEVIRSISKNESLFDKKTSINFLCFRGMCLRLLKKNLEALDCFNKVIQLDKKNGFAYRQIAFIEHENKNFDKAALSALESLKYSNDNPEHILYAATVLAFNRVKYFKKAKELFIKAYEKSGFDLKFKKELDKFLEAEKVLTYFIQALDDDMIPTEVIKSLRPGLKILQIFFKNNSAVYKDQLLTSLHEMEAEIISNVEDLNEIIEGIDLEKDYSFKGMYLSNLGRIMYLQWKENEALFDTKDILKIFQTSLAFNSNNPFTHCWLGTYYKEVEKNYIKAEEEYLKAIELSKKSKSNIDKDHPLFTHNMGLLILDLVIDGKLPKEKIYEAKSLLNTSNKLSKKNSQNFTWPEYNLTRCLLYIENMGGSTI